MSDARTSGIPIFFWDGVSGAMRCGAVRGWGFAVQRREPCEPGSIIVIRWAVATSTFYVGFVSGEHDRSPPA
jgi:hypothetical protein